MLKHAEIGDDVNSRLRVFVPGIAIDWWRADKFAQGQIDGQILLCKVITRDNNNSLFAKK